ncbi:hypothetical protein A2U01_0056090 [Trifolium medium]|uniref:Uncharacterized protein n=1 Tax=Trifolium medium TaxID=97028 RepID=A0A392RF45_9FABA|nr:hypothetical protein [Trifolium medium]
MENWQEQFDTLRSDVDQMADKLDRILEVLTKLNLHLSNEGSVAAQVIQVPMGTNKEFSASQPRAHQVLPRDVVSQKSQGDHNNAYQSLKVADQSNKESSLSTDYHLTVLIFVIFLFAKV